MIIAVCDIRDCTEYARARLSTRAVGAISGTHGESGPNLDLCLRHAQNHTFQLVAAPNGVFGIKYTKRTDESR